jgi:hypothetical protein
MAAHDHDNCCEMRMRAPEERPWTQDDVDWVLALPGSLSATIVGDTLHVSVPDYTPMSKRAAHMLAQHFEGIPVEWACKEDPGLC